MNFSKIFNLKNGTIIKSVKYSTLPKLPACNHTPIPYNGPSYETNIKIRKTRLNPVLTTFYKKPLMLTSGHMQWLYDHEGNRYLDMFGGIVTVSVGHCHPEITKVAHKQFSQLCHTTNIYLHPKIQEYAEKLTDKMPGNLKVAYFVNSGSEANDLATLMARLYTKNNDIISLRNCYHGLSPNTMAIVGSSSYKFNVVGPSGMLHTMNPDVFQGLWGGKYCRDSPSQTLRSCSCVDESSCEAADNYYKQLEEVFRYSLPKGHVAAFIAESIQGVGGVVQYPKGYIKKAVNLVRQNGGVYIADEVQTGFGRTGDHYWGFEMHDVMPEIVTMAKGIGNGFPLAAVITTPEVASSLTHGYHFNTFGGNPVACAVGSKVLDIIDKEKYQERCKELGEYLFDELNQLRAKYDCIGDVRGKGLMCGVELVESKANNKPMKPEQFADIFETCKENRLLIGKGGFYGNVFRIKPPMCITKADIDYTIAIIKYSIEQHEDKKY